MNELGIRDWVFCTHCHKRVAPIPHPDSLDYFQVACGECGQALTPFFKTKQELQDYINEAKLPEWWGTINGLKAPDGWVSAKAWVTKVENCEKVNHTEAAIASLDGEAARQEKLGTGEIFSKNFGESVPTVAPSDLKRAYELRLRFSSAIGIGIDDCVQDGSDVQAVGFRLMMLMALVMLCERQPSDPLAPWRKGNELDDAVIKVAAYAPVKYKRKFTGFPFDMEPETFFQQVQNEAR